MHRRVALWLLLAWTLAAADQAYQYDEKELFNDDDDFYDEDEASETSEVQNTLSPETLTRVRRYGTTGRGRLDVKGALKQLFFGRRMQENLLTFTTDTTTMKHPAENMTLIVKPRSPEKYDADQFISSDSSENPSETSITLEQEQNASIVWRAGNSTTTPSTPSAATASTPSVTATTTTTTKRSTTPRFDIEALLDIVANLTYDYDTNLTQVLNDTLHKFSIPTCRTPTTTVTTTTVGTIEEIFNTTVISKCFVCGLDTPGIPRNTFCSDAFSTDFIPLIPIDGTAKGHIASFKKYCRYFDVDNYRLNKSDSRAMLGRWTGGCSVRWIDLSGVYTQRTCRNSARPTMGLHFASKRMAKLEHALSNVEEGCIISPMASLVPLSRGISLYARFHACVCSGSWCNRTAVLHQCSNYVYIIILLLLLTVFCI